MTVPAAVRHWERSIVCRAGLDRLVRDRVAGVRRHAPLGAALLTALMLHVAVAPHLAVRGAAPEVMLVAVAGVAVSRGPRAGAAFGFAAGFGADLFLATPLGTAALGYTLVGHALGRRSRPSAARMAAALCRPDSPCFACRAGRKHAAGPAVEPVRLRRRAANRRAALRQAVLLAGVAVAAGRIVTAAVAMALAGVPFPDTAGLRRVAIVAIVSAPLGPPVFAAIRRLPAPPSGGRSP